MADEIMEYDLTYSILSSEWHGKAIVEPVLNKETINRLFVPMLAGMPTVSVETGDYDADGMPVMVSIPVEGYKTILADCRGRDDLPQYLRKFVPIHTPKESYRIITNDEIWDCMESAIADLEGSGVKVTTVGTLQNLRKFYISVDLGDGQRKTAKGDKIASILNFRSAHDGSMNLEAGDSHTRIVCMNTFRWSRAYQGAIDVRVSHTKNAAIAIANLGTYLNTVLAGREKMIESISHLETLEASPSHAAYVAASYLTEKAADEISTRTFNRAVEIRDLSVTGKGNSGKSRYDVFNGFTEYFTHGSGAGGEKASKAKRWSVSNFGAAADHKEGFLNLLLNESDYSEALERGEKLFRDKEQALLCA
jgi:hypothetical protein